MVGFIGCGNMGSVLAGVASKTGKEILVSDHNFSKLERLRKEYNVIIGKTADIAKDCQFIFLGVKPQVMQETVDEIKNILYTRTERFIIVSMAAGVKLTSLTHMIGDYPLIRIMPNIPASVGKGVILYCVNEQVREEEEQDFLTLMNAAGMVAKIEEEKIDAASAITGCAPAYVSLFIEAMIDSAIRCGLPREQATTLTLQTVMGTSAFMLETGIDPAALRAAVCSPAGSTIEGVVALEKYSFRYAIIEAITAAYHRSIEMGRK